MEATSHSPAPIRSRRLLFLTGKGGVGKTTVTAALALAFADRGERVLIAMGGAHERLSSLLQTAPIGHEITLVRERIWATRIVPEIAMEEYGQLVVGVKAITRLVFANQYTHAFFRAVPGLPEWAVLGKAWYLSNEQEPDGTPRFDTVLFDAPSTGHALHMLSIPTVIVALAPAGALRRDAEQALGMFQDPARAGAVLVTRTEDMAVTETMELASALRERLRIPLWGVVLNGVRTPMFRPDERVELCARAMGRAPALQAAASVVTAAARRAVREQTEERAIERLEQAVEGPFLRLPFLVEGADMPDAIEQLARVLVAR